MYYRDRNRDKAALLLGREFWYGQMYGLRGPAHARFMRPRCQVLHEVEGKKSDKRSITLYTNMGRS
jgi:hypothetical protein